MELPDFLFTASYQRKKRQRSSAYGVCVHAGRKSEGTGHVYIGEPVETVLQCDHPCRQVKASVMAGIVKAALDGVAHEVVQNHSYNLPLEFEVVEKIPAHQHSLSSGVRGDDDLIALGKKISHHSELRVGHISPCGVK